MKYLVLIALVFGLHGIPQGALAQIPPTGLATGGPTLELAPAFPEPNEAVAVTFNDYGVASGQGTIRWFEDGVEIVEFRNQRTITYNAPANGQRATLRAVRGEGVTALAASATIIPRYLDLIIEPQTRVPAWYLGRALPSLDSQINASIVIPGPNPGYESLVFSWRVNDTVLFGGPVVGQRQVSFPMPQGTAIVNVTVETKDGQVIGSRAYEILAEEPFLHFYESNPLYGMSHRPLPGMLRLIGSTATVRAEPYYLDLRTFNQPSIQEWLASPSLGALLGQNPYEITISRSDTEPSGEVSFHVRDGTRILQGALARFTVTQ
jgi:hypothetical protein